jgi:hypothetical protein
MTNGETVELNNNDISIHYNKEVDNEDEEHKGMYIDIKDVQKIKKGEAVKKLHPLAYMVE